MGPQETKVYAAVLMLSFVLAGIILYFLASLMRQYRRNLELQKKNSTAAVSAMEQERSRIATDIHDEIAPKLTLARLTLNELKGRDEDDEYRKQSVEIVLAEMLDRIREISFDLMPSALLRSGLVSGVGQLIDTITRFHDLTINFSALHPVTLPDKAAINVFRIIQEILHNAVKHSRATEIVITLEVKVKLLVIKIADDGVGFDYNHQLKETNGFGLRSIQNRVESISGELFVSANKGKGSSFVIEIPIEPHSVQVLKKNP